MSTRRDAQKQQLTDLIDQMNKGDQLIVSELSRLGRSLGQIIHIVDTLTKKEIKLTCIKENIRLGEKKSMQTKIMITLFGLFAEVERDLISERTKAGLARAKEQGRLAGRPKGSLSTSKLDGKEDEILLLLQKGVSKTAIAKITGVHRSTLHSFVQSRNLEGFSETKKLIFSVYKQLVTNILAA
ncbi:recombinase family protein [Endozoicomonas gorgoniicola]|uniref:Recombinase family protein n=1 Tax=Endozoicomonas gorgoniicola TaxID=1234144 RepID=A0ABT3N301_9GAMM|nr:recombinase family protein [Endozoicomonas gorgoniicola]MCW7556009.1 recombinase family protein [Endozoicomonas gorgoniicola]